MDQPLPQPKEFSRFNNNPPQEQNLRKHSPTPYQNIAHRGYFRHEHSDPNNKVPNQTQFNENRMQHPFDMNETEKRINEWRHLIRNIGEHVENSKKSIETFSYRKLDAHGANFININGNNNMRYDVKINNRSPAKREHQISGTYGVQDYGNETSSINFNISCSVDFEDSGEKHYREQRPSVVIKNQSLRNLKTPNQKLNIREERQEVQVDSPIKKISIPVQTQKEEFFIKNSHPKKKQTSSQIKQIENSSDKNILVQLVEVEELESEKNERRKIIQNNVSFSPQRPRVEEFMLSEDELSSLNNTCTKNELENILAISAKKGRNSLKQENTNVKKWKYQSKAGKMPEKKFLPYSPPNKTNLHTSISPTSKRSKNVKGMSKTPKASTTNKNIFQGNESSNSKRSNYIDKYIKNMEKSSEKQIKSSYKPAPNHASTSKTPPRVQKQKSPINRDSGTTTKKKQLKINSSITPVSTNKAKYSHPSKSPQNKQKQRMDVSVITNKKQPNPLVKESQDLRPVLKNSHRGKQWNRESFVNQMSQQCYVKRFLNKDEVGAIYESLYHEGVPKYLWEERLIQKIFDKIHQSDQII